jgi:hypothetical protein
VTEPQGPPLLSFPDPQALGWVPLLAGLACLGGGTLLTGLIAAEGVGELNGDVMAGFCLVASLLLFGLGFSYACLRDIVGKPTWHVSRSHAWRARGGRTVESIALREQPSATVVDTRRNGVTVWFAVQLGPYSIVAPSEDAALQIAQLWQSARRS